VSPLLHRGNDDFRQQPSYAWQGSVLRSDWARRTPGLRPD